MKNDTAIYDLMNSINLYDTYPLVHRVCYALYYYGKCPKNLRKEFNKLQSEDVRKFYYVPSDILNKVNTFLNS